MVIGLDCLRVGEYAVVTGMNVENILRERLRAFGLVPGTRVRCSYRSPGGSVTALAFRGTVVALRTRDLRKIRGVC